MSVAEIKSRGLTSSYSTNICFSNICLIMYCLKVFVIESLQTIGMCVLAFVVLPLLDSVVHSLALLLGAGLVPGLLNLLRGPRDESDNYSPFLLDIFGCLAQASALICWPILIGLGRLPVNHHLVSVSLGSRSCNICQVSKTWLIALNGLLGQCNTFQYHSQEPCTACGRTHIRWGHRWEDFACSKIYLLLDLQS